MAPRSTSLQAALGAIIILASTPCCVQAADAGKYTTSAVQGIETLNRQWYSLRTGIWDDAWWNSANALTTLADFSLVRINEANKLNLGGYMRHTFEQAQKTNVQTVKAMQNGVVTSTYCLDASNGCMAKREFLGKRGFDDFINEFYDDEGWWALGWIRAFDVSGEQQYLNAAVDIFRDMQTGSGTPCGGGIFWNKERKYVNAITNELYLSVAASLANRVPNQKRFYLDIANRQWDWFRRSGMINNQGLINDGLDAQCKNNGLQTWSYNQGVILGGLVELSRANGDRSLIDQAVRIATTAMRALSNQQGVLVETDQCELKQGNCGKDGQQFKGIFVRNLGYLNSVVRRPEFRDFIIRNADSIWAQNRDDANRLGVAWAGPFMSPTGPTQSSALDAIVAAIAVA
ncbi:hypothetical protein HIM_01383 [Hirsutella minnesotensis 3608]|nr:hypothetical protein HIM_01383 [Hirsutella minnesotensis 3608]